MRRYSETVKADLRRRMSPPDRQSVAQISKELGIHIVNLYAWRKTWRLQGEAVQESEKDLEGWSVPTNSRWCWKAPGSMPLNSVSFVVNGACTRCRWTVGARPLLPRPTAGRSGGT
jgi:hypothetical protein